MYILIHLVYLRNGRIHLQSDSTKYCVLGKNDPINSWYFRQQVIDDVSDFFNSEIFGVL